jgi:putative ABC transport system permease protein
MLARKMFRDMKHNFGQFFSVFILAMLAMAMYVTFEGHVLSEENARKVFHKECNTADLWVYGESFSKEQLEDIRNLSFVEDAQLRTKLSGSAPDCGDAQVDIYLADENTVNKAYRISGEEFNPSDKDSVWLTDAFAQKRGIKVGDDFTVKYAGGTFTKKVKGLIESCEYEYRQADGDADVYIENIAFVYMSYDAIDIPVPHTEMDIVTKDGGALAHEDAVAEALNHKYSAIIDRKSVQGLARFDSELKQHESFSYVFALIFIGIAVLVIATSMSRMVEKQRTQIGTMNALGMKRSKILFHYISFSLITSGLGAAAGMLLGVFLGAPYMLDLFGAYYIVPGRKSEFNMIYFAILSAIVVICAFAAYVSCRKLLKIKPAEALRPAAPRAGKKCLAERLPFWEKLSFSARYNLRDISRGKMRAFMSIAGTAFGMLLIVYGAGCNGLLAEMEAIVFDKTTPAQYQIKLAEDADADEVKKLASSLDGELIMTSALEVSAVKNAASSEKQKGVLTVTEGKKLYNILDLDNEVRI